MRRFPLLVVLLLAGCGGAQQAEPPTAPHFVPKATPLRTVLVGRTGTPDAGGPIHAGLLKGRMPSAAMTAVVLTDEDCTPDSGGVSHCRNALRLPDGSKITVRHHHEMQHYSCLTPGEKVRLVPA